ncbi:MAG: PadR family transcriptional regulator [Longimicrobiales bacterium]
MGRKSGLGEFEQLVLLAILRLKEGAFAPEVADELEESVGRSVTRGALYSTLNRMEEKGWVVWETEEPGPGRGGHIRRRFSVTDAGLAELRLSRQTLLTLWDGLEGLLSGGGR